MKKIIFSACALLSLTGRFHAGWFSTADFPQATLSNGLIQTTVYLPDSNQGYYRGTRFDWSGAFKNLEYNSHSFVEPWFEHYDPTLHDAISGPAEEFTALGYTEAKPGGTFVKIGVGVLRKPDDKPYTFARYYEIADPGKRTVKTHKDYVEFTHSLTDPATGYGYEYQKTVRLLTGKPVLVLEHRLKNTGQKAIDASTYNHNFFIIDGQPTGPTVSTQFPFTVAGEGKGFGSTILPQGNRLTYTRELEKKENVFSAGLQGFGPTATDYDIRVGNQKTGAGVRITGDRPLQKLVYWACATTSCPEPYVQLQVPPGGETSWQITYTFYDKVP